MSARDLFVADLRAWLRVFDETDPDYPAPPLAGIRALFEERDRLEARVAELEAALDDACGLLEYPEDIERLRAVLDRDIRVDAALGGKR